MFKEHTVSWSQQDPRPTRFTYSVDGLPLLPPRRIRRAMDWAAARDETWLHCRPHEPGYLRPARADEFWPEAPPAGALVFVRRAGSCDMEKLWAERLLVTKAEHSDGLWRTIVKDAKSGRLQVVLVDERSPGSPDHGPFDAAEELAPEQVATLIRDDPAALRDYAERLRFSTEVYGPARPGWWVPCPACHGARCLWCDGLKWMHPTRADWATYFLPAYGPDVALLRHLLDDGKLDTPAQRAVTLPAGNLRAMELADFMSQDPQFGAFADAPGDDLHRALGLFEDQLHRPNLAEWWNPAESESRSEGEARGILYVMHLLGLGA